MPLEGHFQRVNTPLRKLTRRERNVVGGGLAVTVVAIALLLLLTAGDSKPPPAPGCISVPIAGRTGAELVHRCGIEARELCARAATRDEPAYRAIAAGCRERDIRPLSPPSGGASAG